jgi:hypothetical protein
VDINRYKELEFRRKFFRLFGAQIDIVDPDTQQLAGFIEMKAWKLKEDIRIYSDKTKSQELLRIGARSVIDISATYDVFDSASGQALFYLRRKGLRSAFVRDSWEIYTPQDQLFGAVNETSSGLALARRWIGIIPYAGDIAEMVLGFVPQTYVVTDAQGNVGAEIAHRKNPFIVKFGLDTTNATTPNDMRVNLSVVALLAVIDASKN